MNTGPDNGAVFYLERQLKRPLLPAVCMIHGNELPIKHLIISLDGNTLGPDTWEGPIGKNIGLWSKKPELYVNIPFAKFKKIEGNVPEFINPDLLKNRDIRLLHKFCIGIQKGYCDPELSKYIIGKFTLARWWTQACYICCIYVHTDEENLSTNLEIFATFIVKAYAPQIFDIRTLTDLTNGSYLFHKGIGELPKLNLH